MSKDSSRGISKDKYIAAAVITLCIFLLGLFLGLLVEEKRADYIDNQGREQELVFESLQLQYLFVDQLGEERNCDVISKTFDVSVRDLEDARARLEEFDKTSKISKQNFDTLKRDYTLSQLRYWLLSKKAKTRCNLDLETVLYFYHTDNVCPDCGDQAFLLTYLKKLFGQQLLVFSLDAGLENEPMIEILKETYNITQYPTLIFETKKFENMAEKELLISYICSKIKSKECVNQTI